MTETRTRPARPKGCKGRPRTAKAEPAGIKSVEIVFGILDAFLDHNDQLSLTELSRATGIMTNKLHPYLVSLMRCGMITQSQPSGFYDLGPKARTLGAVALTRFDGFHLVEEEALTLAQRLDVATFICVWSERGMVMVHSHLSRQSWVSIKNGAILPLLSSGCGPVFLACLPKAMTEPVVRREIVDGNAGTWTMAKSLAEQAGNELARNGAYWTENSIIMGAPVCAAPIFEGSGMLHSALGVALMNRPFTKLDRASIISEVASAAARLSQHLGFTKLKEVPVRLSSKAR